MKRTLFLLLMIFLLTVLTGCSNSYIELTEDETNAIAQYCSYLILKYDTNKTDDMRLLDERTFKKEIKKREEESERLKEPEATQPPEAKQPEPTEDVDYPDIDTEPDISSDTGINSDVDENQPTVTDVPEADESSKVTDVPEPVIINTSIEEVLGLTDFTFEYKKISVAASYDTGDRFFSLNAPLGQKLAIIEFTVSNTSSSDLKLDMTDNDSDYVLTDSNSGTHEPVISFLENDLRFFNDTIKAGSTKDVCLIFYLNESTDPVTLKIIGNNTYTINLK